MCKPTNDLGGGKWCRWLDAVGATRCYVIEDDGGSYVRIERSSAPGMPVEYHDVDRNRLVAI